MCYGNHFGMHGGYGHSHKRAGGFGGRWAHGGPWSQDARAGWFQPPVNIQEQHDRYELHLAAPGRNKSDFQLNVQDGILTIVCRKQEESDLGTQQNWIRQEYRTLGFERQFQLNEKIDADSITASYTDGVLVVTLPKLASAHSQTKDVFVA